MQTETVTYRGGDSDLKGYLVHPSTVGPRPGVLLVHEFWGLNEYLRRRAHQIAELGYTAFAIDLYGEGRIALDAEEAGKLMMAELADVDRLAAKFEAARALLAGRDDTDEARLAAIGYCFGGAVVLNMARRGTKLNAVASFHGRLGTDKPMKPGVFDGAILVCHGAKDPLVPPEQLAAFRDEMNNAGAELHVVIHDNATHGFTNPEATARGARYKLPLAYDEEADRVSWRALVDLLAEHWSELY